MVSVMEYHVRVIDVFPRGDSAFSVRFERPPTFSFQPGQYMFITPGTDTSVQTKHLSISSSPSDQYLEVTKGSTGHPFAESLRALKSGDEAVIVGPYGEFTFQGEHSKVAFLAGGIGVTPLWSMIRYATDMLYDTDITLLYSAKTEPNILFQERMTDVAEANPHLSLVLTLTEPDPSWAGHTGRIDRVMIEQEVPDWRDRIFFTSGPLAMVDAMLAVLREMGVPDDKVRYEYFSGY